MQNAQILNKCISELKKESPNLDYVRGILETVVEMSGVAVVTPTTAIQMPISSHIINPQTNTTELSDEERSEEKLLRAYTNGPIANLQ